MNSLGLALIWITLQVSSFCLVGAGAYWIARRRHPAAGAWAAWCMLLIAVVIPLLSLSPWPRWWTLADAIDAARHSREPIVAKTAPQSETTNERSNGTMAPDEPSVADRTTTVQFEFTPFWSRLSSGIRNQAQIADRADRVEPRWGWTAWVAVLAIAATGLGITRVLIGWLSLIGLVRRTRPIFEPEMIDLIADLRRRLHCRPPIELREVPASIAGGAPAVVGWRRPVILLPAGWREWNDAARQIVLAHEVAHVARGDFGLWLIAQAGVVMNYCNPLVHWIASRLRLEQELAADLSGAEMAGGRKSYVNVLARMALCQDAPKPLWAGRPFLPTRGTLIRRIEMLHNPRSFAEFSPSRWRSVPPLAALVLIGLAIAGMRGPSGAALAESPAPNKTAETSDSKTSALETTEKALPKFDLSYLPGDTALVFSIKPLKVGKATFTPIILGFPGAEGMSLVPEGQKIDFEVEENRIIMFAKPPEVKADSKEQSYSPAGVIIYRMREPYDWSKLRVKIFGSIQDGVVETVVCGQKCFRAISETSGKAVYLFLPDDRTIAWVMDEDLPQVLAADSTRRPAWYDRWLELNKNPIAIAGNMNALAAGEGEAEGFATIGGKHTDLIFAHAVAENGGLKVVATGHCTSDQETQALATSIKQAIALYGPSLSHVYAPDHLPTEFRGLNVDGELTRILQQCTLTQNAAEKTVRVEFQTAPEFLASLSDAYKSWAERFNEEDREARTKTLHRLLEALDAYHAAHGHYPPSSIIGPDGKTAHSWRVELLPYLGEQKLYDSYKLDEPWDGPNNKQLFEKVPGAYTRVVGRKDGYADYYLVAGPGTLFDGNPKPKREQIADAAADTILVISDHRRVAWTKPEDIQRATDLVQLKSYSDFQRGFYAGFADGSVRFISRDTDVTTLRAMFTIAGGEEVKLR